MAFAPSDTTITAAREGIVFGRASGPSAPTAEFTSAAVSGSVPLSVPFADQSDGLIDSWSWDFGDGHTSTAQNPTHVYVAQGAYTVELTVTGPGGSSTRTRTAYITAQAVLPTGPVLTSVDLTAATTGVYPFAIGHPFRQGDVPAGAGLEGLQLSVKSTWPDGSVKFGVVAGTASLTSGALTALNLRTGNPAAGVALTTTGLTSQSLTAAIDAGAAGSASWSGSDWDTPHETWVSGPVMSSWRYRKAIGSDANLVAWLEVRLWADGEIEVLPWIENGFVHVAGCAALAETFTFTLQGTQRESIAATMPGRTRLVLITGTKLAHWAGAAKDVTALHDSDYLRRTKLVPNYSQPVATATVNSWPGSITAPHEQGLYRTTMSAGGGSVAIGLLPQWDVAAVMDGGEKAWRVCQQQAYRAGRYGCYMRDESTQAVPRLSQHPTTVFGKTGQGIKDAGVSSTDSYSAAQTGATPPEWAVSHLTSMGYVAALLTGRRFHCETTQFNAFMVTGFQSTPYRGNGSGIMSTDSYMQVRGVGWGIRTVAHAVVVSADNDALQAEFKAHLNATATYNHSLYVAQASHPFGVMRTNLPGLGDYETGNPQTYAPWMHDFVVQAVGYARHLTGDGLTEAVKFTAWFNWLGKSVAFRCGTDASAANWPYIDAADYAFVSVAVEGANWTNGSGPWPATAGELWDMTFLAGTGGRNNVYLQNNPPTIRSRSIGDGSLRGGLIANPFNYWHNMLPALAYCVEFGITGAAEGYELITTAPNWVSGVSSQGFSEMWMVSPRSGTLENWVAGAEVGSLVNGLWTPGRDVDGRITQASIDALPANQWVRVAGTEWSVLEALVVATGFSPYTAYDFGTNKTIRSTFYSWVGCCDDGRRVYYPRGGGHVDSSVNGMWALDLLKMQWEVVKAPSKHNAAGFEWSSNYKVGGSFTNYINSAGTTVDSDGLYWDKLPDGMPTAAHTYNGVWFDSKRRTIGTGRVSKWAYSLESGQWTRQRWTWGGGAPTVFTINQECHYHAGRDAVYGYPARNDQDNYSFGKFAAGGSAWTPLAICANFAAQSTAMSSVRLDNDRVLFLWSLNGERWGIYNMATETWAPGSGNAITDGRAQSYTAEMQAAIYIPTWGAAGQVIRRGTAGAYNGAWWIFDVATKANLPYTPAGSAPAWLSWPGNKYRSIPRLGIAMVLNDSSGTNTAQGVHLMRYE